MPFQDFPRKKAIRCVFGGMISVSASIGLAWFFTPASMHGLTSTANAQTSQPEKAADQAPPDSVDLTEAQAQRLKAEPIGYRVFQVQDDAIGSIAFNGDLQTQVFTPYQGRILSLFARIGDDVQKGQPLYTIDSSDLIQAESTLISTAGVLRLTTRALDRAKDLYAAKGIAQKDFDQAISDQQAAEGAFKAAVDAVRIFGKTQADVERIEATRKIDAVLVIPSPINGRVTDRNASPGLFVQAGSSPAPYTVTDVSTMWMLANVPESTIPRYHLGQHLKVTVSAMPDKIFEGKITTMGAAVDPATRRLFLRSEIADPEHLLRSGMFASFVIDTGVDLRSLALPASGIVRQGDGTMTAWITTDRRTFTQRTVTIGLSQSGYVQIIDGLKPGELVATDGALFLNNALYGVDE